MQPASTKMITCRIKQFLCLGKGKPETYAHLHDRLGPGAVGDPAVPDALVGLLREQRAPAELGLGHPQALDVGPVEEGEGRRGGLTARGQGGRRAS